MPVSQYVVRDPVAPLRMPSGLHEALGGKPERRSSPRGVCADCAASSRRSRRSRGSQPALAQIGDPSPPKVAVAVSGPYRPFVEPLPIPLDTRLPEVGPDETAVGVKSASPTREKPGGAPPE